jgi:hypothetical protein
MEYTQWADPVAGFCREIHRTFLETMIEKKDTLLKPDGETLEEEKERLAKTTSK